MRCGRDATGARGSLLITVDEEPFDQGLSGPIDDHGFYGISTAAGLALVLAPAEKTTDHAVVEIFASLGTGHHLEGPDG